LEISSPFDEALYSISLSSSVERVSPNSLATLLMLLSEMNPVLSSSNKSKILSIPSLVSLLPNFFEIASRNYSKLISLPNVSNSHIIS
jgi:hypothetical protein